MNAIRIIAILASILLSACAAERPKTMTGADAATGVAPTAKTASEVPANLFTQHYKVIIYPGSGKDFNPEPKLTLEEFTVIGQFDLYCTKEADKLEGEAKEMLKQAGKYGFFEGFLGAIGYRLGFGSLIHPSDYLLAIGMTAAGGGGASGSISYEMAMSVLQGYCMTGMVYKANELEGKLKRLWIAPVYVGGAKLPAVSDQPAPTFKKQGTGYVPPLPR